MPRPLTDPQRADKVRGAISLLVEAEQDLSLFDDAYDHLADALRLLRYVLDALRAGGES